MESELGDMLGGVTGMMPPPQPPPPPFEFGDDRLLLQSRRRCRDEKHAAISTS
jgi:hypothetical protein